MHSSLLHTNMPRIIPRRVFHIKRYLLSPVCIWHTPREIILGMYECKRDLCISIRFLLILCRVSIGVNIFFMYLYNRCDLQIVSHVERCLQIANVVVLICIPFHVVNRGYKLKRNIQIKEKHTN